MSAHVLLIFLNELRNEFNRFINTRARMLQVDITYKVTLRLL